MRNVSRATLTKREIEVLALVAQGYTEKGVATALGISGETVNNHLRSIYLRLGAVNRAHAVAIGVSRGLVEVTA